MPAHTNTVIAEHDTGILDHFVSHLGKPLSLQGYTQKPSTRNKMSCSPTPSFTPFPISCQCQTHVFFLILLQCHFLFLQVSLLLSCPGLPDPQNLLSFPSIYYSWSHLVLKSPSASMMLHSLGSHKGPFFSFTSSFCSYSYLFWGPGRHFWVPTKHLHFYRYLQLNKLRGQWQMLIHAPFLFPNGEKSISIIHSLERKEYFN